MNTQSEVKMDLVNELHRPMGFRLVESDKLLNDEMEQGEKAIYQNSEEDRILNNIDRERKWEKRRLSQE